MDTQPSIDFGHISYNQAGAWSRCQYKWKLSYIDKWVPKGKSPGLALGGMVDEMLNLHYSGGSWLEIMELAKTFFDRPGADVTLISRAIALMDKYVHDWARVKDTKWKILEVQKYIDVPFETPEGNVFMLEGYLDLLIEINSKIWLVETKTYGGGQWGWSDKELQMEAQSPTYIAGLRKMGIDVYGVIYNLMNTYDYKNPAETEKYFQREKIYKTPAEIDNIVLQLGATVDEIINHKGLYRKNMTRDCKFCPFQEPCLYDIKGIDNTHFLEMIFQKKEPRPGREKASEGLELDFSIL